MSMIIYPAIDLLDGECVRLFKGDYGTAEKVAEDAIQTAERFINDGAAYLHTVDLNAAKTGENINLKTIEKLAKLPIKVQTGGGIRSLEKLKMIFDAGVSRAIIGSAAITDTEFLQAALNKYGDKIAVGVDALNGEVRTHGWVKGGGINYIDFVLSLEKLGVKTVIFTDISLDGTLSGVDTESLLNLKNAVKMDIIASGGVKNITDIIKLKKVPVQGVICGKSLYSGSLNLKEALATARK